MAGSLPMALRQALGHSVPPPCLALGPLAPLLQWTATSRGSRNRTCRVVPRGSAARLWRSCGLRLRIEGGHLLSPSWGVGSRGRRAEVSSSPGPLEAGDGQPGQGPCHLLRV